jgi:hypothetical protein
MAHVAELDENNKVLRVIVVHNDYEPHIERFAYDTFGGIWKQTSYHASFRGKYAGIGDYYDPTNDIFVAEIVLNGGD